MAALETERLRLRPFRAADVAAFERFAWLEEYRRFLGDHPAPAEFVANNLGADGAWVIELGEVIVGSIFLGYELACLLDPAVHGRGIALEAARAVVADGFDRRGYTEIVANSDPENVASVRALRRLGFREQPDGRYSLSRSDWKPAC